MFSERCYFPKYMYLSCIVAQLNLQTLPVIILSIELCFVVVVVVVMFVPFCRHRMSAVRHDPTGYIRYCWGKKNLKGRPNINVGESFDVSCSSCWIGMGTQQAKLIDIMLDICSFSILFNIENTYIFDRFCKWNLLHVCTFD